MSMVTQCAEHQLNIFNVAEYTPETAHSQPSKEIAFYREALRRALQPENLVVRQFAYMIDGRPPRDLPHTSRIIRGDVAPEGSLLCPAPTTDHKCGECRECWNPERQDVSYSLL